MGRGREGRGRKGRGGRGGRGRGRGGMTLYILMGPQYLNSSHVLRNNVSRHFIGSTPNNGT